jgi:hypothetical protein
MKRLALPSVTFVVALTLVALGCGAVQLQTTAATLTSQVAAANPCAAKPGQPCAVKNPCAPPANPCAAKSPCAAKNPCGTVQACAAKPAVAKMIKGEIVAADLTKNLLSVRHEGHELALQLDRLTSVRQGPTSMTLADLQAGQQATVSYVERNGQRTAKYIYLASAAAANPYGANPCAAKNPYAAKNPCAPKANPCAATGKNPCGANPCAPQKR